MLPHLRKLDCDSIAKRKLWERIRAKIRINGTCYEWTGPERSKKGYGSIKYKGKSELVHRVVYMIFRGPISPGLVIDHLCDNPKCVRLEHLEVKTFRANTLRADSIVAQQARKTQCLRGHPLDDTGDVLIHTNKRGHKIRICRVCRRLRSQKHKSVAKLAAVG